MLTIAGDHSIAKILLQKKIGKEGEYGKVMWIYFNRCSFHRVLVI